jgi:putative ABC transport system permease protein
VTRMLLLTGLRDLLRRPYQTALMILGVALGVAVVVAIDLANDSAARAFALSTEAVTGKATHQIVGGPGGVPESVYRDLRVTRADRLSAPVVDGYARAAALGGQTVRVVGVDPFAEAPFRTYLTSGSNAPPEALSALFTRAGAVLLGADAAARYNLRAGESFTLTVGSVPRTVVLAGVLRPADDTSRRALDGLVLCDIATAQELFAREGRLTRIDLIATDAQAAAIAAELPPGLRVVPATQQRDTVAQLTDAFRLNLTALSLLALVVGMFLIYNTVMFSVVQRRAVLGILRCLGVTGEQVFALIVLETALAAALGAAAGLLLGIVLGRAAVGLVTQTINDLYFAVTVGGVDVQPLTLFKGFALGLLAAILAACAPALEAASVPPVTALQRSDLEARVRRYAPGLLAGGALLLALGAALIFAVPHSLFAAFGGLFAGVLGAALAVPALTVLLMRAAGVLLARAGLLGRMAARTVTNALSRTSVAIAALMIAVAVTIGVTVMIDSFRATVENWLALTLRADIYISAAETAAGVSPELAPGLDARVSAVPGVAAIEDIRSVDVTSPDLGAVHVNAASRGRPRDARLFRFVEGDPAQVWQFVEQGAVLVTEPFAYRHGVTTGDTVTLLTDRGAHAFSIAGVYYDYSSDRGSVLMSLNVYRRYWDDSALTGVAVYAAPGASLDALAEALRAALGDQDVLVQPNRALRDAALVIFDRTFTITAALRLLAVVVAFIGVLSALMALQLERTRELATLRALGLTQGQLWQLTLLETGLIGATAGLLALPTGLALSAVLVFVINLRSFGWTIYWSATPEVYVQALGVSVVAALLAAVYPALRLGRMEIAAALRQE